MIISFLNVMTKAFIFIIIRGEQAKEQEIRAL